jgi:hypothetical protein
MKGLSPRIVELSISERLSRFWVSRTSGLLSALNRVFIVQIYLKAMVFFNLSSCEWDLSLCELWRFYSLGKLVSDYGNSDF